MVKVSYSKNPRKKITMKEMGIMENITEAFGNSEETIMGTTARRQEDLDALCRQVKSGIDLSAMEQQARNKGTSFGDYFKGFNGQLKPAHEHNIEGKHLFVVDEQLKGNPLFLKGNSNLRQEDRLTPTFTVDGINKANWGKPTHYKSYPVYTKVELGCYMGKKDMIGVKAFFRGKFPEGVKTWGVYTTLFTPSIPAIEWFHEFARLEWGCSPYDEYAELTEELRIAREAAWEQKQQAARGAGSTGASGL